MYIMKTLFIIIFVISILAKHILCSAETSPLTDKNNTKNGTTESNIYDAEANSTTQNNINISNTESISPAYIPPISETLDRISAWIIFGTIAGVNLIVLVIWLLWLSCVRLSHCRGQRRIGDGANQHGIELQQHIADAQINRG